MHIKLKGKHAKYAAHWLPIQPTTQPVALPLPFPPPDPWPLICILKQATGTGLWVGKGQDDWPNYKTKVRKFWPIIIWRAANLFIYMLRNQFGGADRKPNNKQYFGESRGKGARERGRRKRQEKGAGERQDSENQNKQVRVAVRASQTKGNQAQTAG